MFRRISLATLIFGLACAFHAVSVQTAYGRILGTVMDFSGAVIVNADVTVRNVGINVSNETRTSEEGYYEVPNLILGKYQIVVEVPGFNRFVAGDLVVLVDQTLRVDAGL